MALAFVIAVCQGGAMTGENSVEMALDMPVQTEIRLHENIELEDMDDMLSEKLMSYEENHKKNSYQKTVVQEDYEENIEAYKDQGVYTRENKEFSHNPDVSMDTYKENTKEYLAKASWYGPGFHGRLTANGEIFDENKLTAAHKELAFGTKVKVTNLRNGKSIVVKINDRGPYINGRHLDLSRGAARKIDMIDAGVVDVKMEIIQ